MPVEKITIRSLQTDDIDASRHLFFRAVHQGAASHYTAEQLNAWAPQPPERNAWEERLQNQSCFMAVQDGVLIGFMTLTESGYLDLAFVEPKMIGKGIAHQIYGALEVFAASRNLMQLATDASLVAVPFFTRHGWEVVKNQTVERSGVTLKNVSMMKQLT
ncbi:MAG: GNAT family N-acetyltransferase [Pseudomonadota bacterium]